MKQTAVEWLIHILKGQQDKPFKFEEWMIAMEHAKEMEKEQIVQAFEHIDFNLDDGLHYYEQIYESKT